jgi:arylformamidase
VQTVNYLAATNLEVGLLINFGASSLQFKRKHRTRISNPVNSVNPVLKNMSARGTFIDITHPHSNSLAPWPGDTPFDFRFVARLRDGASCNVGKLTCSIHTGTHADAPFHYNDSGATIDALPPELFIGAARVFLSPGGGEITRDVFAGLDAQETPRVLVRTNHCDDKSIFPARIPTLAADVPAWLGAQGVRLIGLDVPSVDQVDSKTLPIHHALDAAEIIILENLDLRAAAPGVYELIALPLKIAGADGSPIRAVLREK